MVGRFPHGLTAGTMAGATIAGLAAVAHVSAGGELGGTGSIVALLGVVVLSAVLGRRLRWTFPRVLLVSLAVQPFLHALFTAGGPSGDALHNAHAHHHMATAPADAGHPSMPVVHAAVALVAALVIRWGVRWLRSMPELVRAVAFAMRRVGVVPPAAAMALTPMPVLAGGRQAMPTWTCRGPPG